MKMIFGTLILILNIYDNSHPINADLMKDIATFARKSLDISKPIYLHGLRFARVTQKTEWTQRTVQNITLPSFPGSVEDFLNSSESSNCCFI